MVCHRVFVTGYLSLADDQVVFPESHHDIHLAVVRLLRIICNSSPQRTGGPILLSFNQQFRGANCIALVVFGRCVATSGNSLHQSLFTETQKCATRAALLSCHRTRRIQLLHRALPTNDWIDACCGVAAGRQQCCFSVSICHVEPSRCSNRFYYHLPYPYEHWSVSTSCKMFETFEATRTGLASNSLAFGVQGCNFEGIAPTHNRNHNRLWKRPLYVVCRPVCRCGVIWAIRQFGDVAWGFLEIVLGVPARKIA